MNVVWVLSDGECRQKYREVRKKLKIPRNFRLCEFYTRWTIPTQLWEPCVRIIISPHDGSKGTEQKTVTQARRLL